MKKSFASLSKLTVFNSQSSSAPESRPITDFVKAARTSKPKATQETSPITDFIKNVRASNEKKRSDPKAKTSKKHSSTNDLQRLKLSRPSRSNLRRDNVLRQEDMNDIYEMIQQLNSSSLGQKMLKDFVHQQAFGKAARVPAMMELEEAYDCDSIFVPPAEIIVPVSTDC